MVVLHQLANPNKSHHCQANLPVAQCPFLLLNNLKMVEVVGVNVHLQETSSNHRLDNSNHHHNSHSRQVSLVKGLPDRILDHQEATFSRMVSLRKMDPHLNLEEISEELLHSNHLFSHHHSSSKAHHSWANQVMEARMIMGIADEDFKLPYKIGTTLIISFCSKK